MPIDPNTLPQDADALRKMVLDVAEQLDRASAEQYKYRDSLRELLEAQRSRKSERLSKEQLSLFETLWKAAAAGEDESEGDDIDDDPPGSGKPEGKPRQKPRGRQPLARSTTVPANRQARRLPHESAPKRGPVLAGRNAQAAQRMTDAAMHGEAARSAVLHVLYPRIKGHVGSGHSQ